jgi:flagellar hook-associated protein 3 FlgL
MTVTSISAKSMMAVQSIMQTRAELDQLQAQLGTGQKSTTYAGLGTGRGLSVTLNSQLSALSSFDDTIAQLGVRLDIGQQTLGQIATLGASVKTSALTSTFNLGGGGQTVEQTGAASSLDQVLSLLNTKVGNRYMFSGSATDAPTTASTDAILNGDATHAGFKQVAAERLQADLGANGLGRLVVARTGPALSISEDAAGSPFGFKISGITTNVTGATVTAPTGSPPSESISFAGSSPAAGQTVTLQLALPDGTSTKITLTATTSTSPGPNEFTVGGSNGATVNSLKAAVNTALGTEAKTSLTAASAMAAANNFFNIDASHPPQRVAGPPFATATALRDGTSADTVSWYTGEAGSDPARSTASARVDPTISVSYGMRANEQAFTSMIGAMAVYATKTYSSSDPNASAAYAAMSQRVVTSLDGPPGQQKVSDIEAELAGAQTTIAATKDRHAQTSATVTDMLQSITGVSPEEVGTKILALQTSLQATLQTTAMMYQTSILNYLPNG